VRLYIACGNLIVTEDQEQNLQSQTQHLTDNVRTYNRNILLRLCYCCWRINSISCTYSECGSLVLSKHHAKHLLRIMLSYSVSGSTIFFHIIS